MARSRSQNDLITSYAMCNCKQLHRHKHTHRFQVFQEWTISKNLEKKHAKKQRNGSGMIWIEIFFCYFYIWFVKRALCIQQPLFFRTKREWSEMKSFILLIMMSSGFFSFCFVLFIVQPIFFLSNITYHFSCSCSYLSISNGVRT